jgi:hypothetical protein
VDPSVARKQLCVLTFRVALPQEVNAQNRDKRIECLTPDEHMLIIQHVLFLPHVSPGPASASPIRRVSS